MADRANDAAAAGILGDLHGCADFDGTAANTTDTSRFWFTGGFAAQVCAEGSGFGL